MTGTSAAPRPLSQGLPPVVGSDPRVLVLGSMPGGESLRLRQYYAHPRNHFWPLMQDVLGIPHDLDYPARIAALADRGVAVWDVLAACERRGSLDAAIVRGSMRTNDVLSLLRAQPGIRRVLFNGVFAETVFRREILAGQPLPGHVAMCQRLPSTSPANASRAYADKRAAWRSALAPS